MLFALHVLSAFLHFLLFPFRLVSLLVGLPFSFWLLIPFSPTFSFTPFTSVPTFLPFLYLPAFFSAIRLFSAFHAIPLVLLFPTSPFSHFISFPILVSGFPLFLALVSSFPPVLPNSYMDKCVDE